MAFLARDLEAGGAEGQLLVLASGLRARGHSVVVLPMRAGGRLEQAFATIGVEVRPLSSSRWSLPAVAVRLPAALRVLRPDVIHGYLPLANCLAVGARLVAPRAVAVMGVRGVVPERQEPLRRVKAFYALEALCARFASAIVTNSEQARREIVTRGFPADRVHVVPNGIDVERFTRQEVLRERLRTSWSVGQDDIVIGRVGGLRPIKDFPTFLRAAAIVADRRPGARFVCVGDGPLRSELERLSCSLRLESSLLWLGHREDMPAVMSALDVLVSSSVSESFPNVVAEAMACGVPCVVTKVGESAAIVGDTGSVVPIGAADAMAEAIIDVVDRLAREGDALRRRVRDRIVSRFGVETMITRTERILLCSGSARGRPGTPHQSEGSSA